MTADIVNIDHIPIQRIFNLSMKSQAGLEPPPADDTSYEADALPNKPPWLDVFSNLCYCDEGLSN